MINWYHTLSEMLKTLQLPTIQFIIGYWNGYTVMCRFIQMSNYSDGWIEIYKNWKRKWTWEVSSEIWVSLEHLNNLCIIAAFRLSERKLRNCDSTYNHKKKTIFDFQRCFPIVLSIYQFLMTELFAVMMNYEVFFSHD